MHETSSEIHLILYLFLKLVQINLMQRYLQTM